MTIGTIGVGLFILILIWISALICFVIGIKFQSNLGWLALGFALAVTILLLIVPIEHKPNLEKKSDDIANQPDYLIVYKKIFLAFLFLVCVFGFISYFIHSCLSNIQPRKIRGTFHEN